MGIEPSLRGKGPCWRAWGRGAEGSLPSWSSDILSSLSRTLSWTSGRLGKFCMTSAGNRRAWGACLCAHPPRPAQGPPAAAPLPGALRPQHASLGGPALATAPGRGPGRALSAFDSQQAIPPRSAEAPEGCRPCATADGAGHPLPGHHVGTSAPCFPGGGGGPRPLGEWVMGFTGLL